MKQPDEKGSPDRVWFTDDLKLYMGGEYGAAESASFSCGMSSDVKPGESTADAFDRVRKEVERQLFRKAMRVRKGLWKEVLQ
jgi:hypothetical protein